MGKPDTPNGFLLWAASAALIFSLAVACGGGGGNTAAGVIVPAGELRSDVRFGYYAGTSLTVLENSDHVNLHWATGWAGSGLAWHLEVALELQLARGAGARNIVLHLQGIAPADLRFQLQRLSESGQLAGWDSIVLYPMDEPESDAGGRLSDAEVLDRLATVKAVAAATPGLERALLGVFYECASGKRPGIGGYDLVGCFRYEANGCARLEADYAELRRLKRSDAKLWLIPGGANIGKVGRQDPACWASYAHRFADVWAVIGFLWQDFSLGPGIRVNGLRRLYCEMGRTFISPAVKPRCA